MSVGLQRVKTRHDKLYANDRNVKKHDVLGQMYMNTLLGNCF